VKPRKEKPVKQCVAEYVKFIRDACDELEEHLPLLDESLESYRDQLEVATAFEELGLFPSLLKIFGQRTRLILTTR